MIEDKKILCAFIYGAYASKLCGMHLKEKRERLTELCLDYIKHGIHFPKSDIISTAGDVTNAFKGGGIRNYIYREHYYIVRDKNLPPETRLDCFTNFYEVFEVEEGAAIGENIFRERKKGNLIILPGLETPERGDIISSHWDHMLEIVSEWPGFEKFKKIAKKQFSMK